MRYLIYILILGHLLLSCSRESVEDVFADDGSQVEALDSLTASGDYAQAIAYARDAYSTSLDNGNAAQAVRLGARLGRLYYMTFEPDSMYWYFDAVMQTAESQKMYQELMMIHNTTGVFNLINALEYENAMHQFHLGMAYAEECGDMDYYYRMMVNVCIIHYVRKDPNGLASAGEIYDYGVENDKPYFVYIGSLMYAYMYHALGDDAKALEYLEEGMRWPEFSTGSNSSDPLYASVLAAVGRSDEAERIFLHCLNEHTDEDSTLRVEAYAEYGRFLMHGRRYEEAVYYLSKGLEITEKYHLYFYGYAIYQELSEIYLAMGQYEQSVKFLNKYYEIKDNVFNVEKERSFNNLIQKYDRQQNEMRLQEMDMQLLKQRQLLEMICAAFVVALILVLAVVMRNRTQNRMYQQLIIKYNSYQKREEALLQRLAEAGRKSTSESERIKELFERMCKVMQEQRMYTQKNLTIEDVAARLGTNRSYLSKAVNTYAGVSFNVYLNSMRIRESIRILSDPENDVPIKQVADEVGYSNITSFYNNFAKETGVPPSKYRSELKNMKL